MDVSVTVYKSSENNLNILPGYKIFYKYANAEEVLVKFSGLSRTQNYKWNKIIKYE